MRKKPIIHPFLFAIFPILFLFSQNIGQVVLTDVLFSVLIAVSYVLLFLLILGFILKNYRKAGIIVSVSLLLFFSYGHVYNSVVGTEILGLEIGRHRFLASLWLFLFTIAFWTTARIHKEIGVLTSLLNIMAATLVLISLFTIAIQGTDIWSKPVKLSSNNVQINIEAEKTSGYPDIYYIILDGYARASTLENIYGYDNSKFLDMLTDKGFYIASKSRCNYIWTYLSLASSLNMNYLKYFSEKFPAKSTKCWKVPTQLIEDNEVQKFLKSIGYLLVIVSSGWGATDRSGIADIHYKYDGYNEFERSLIRTTGLSIFEALFIGEDLRRRILFNFNALSKVSEIKGPKLAFAHIVAPHPPFIFDSNGEPVRNLTFGDHGEMSWSNRNQYIGQLVFLNKKIKQIVETILSKSDIPPIIVLQADHGPASTFTNRSWDDPTDEMIRERMDIFNAYYLPEGGNELLYDSITPVNTFRLIFRYYFHKDYELLEDRSYYSTYEQPYQFIDIATKIAGK